MSSQSLSEIVSSINKETTPIALDKIISTKVFTSGSNIKNFYIFNPTAFSSRLVPCSYNSKWALIALPTGEKVERNRILKTTLSKDETTITLEFFTNPLFQDIETQEEIKEVAKLFAIANKRNVVDLLLGLLPKIVKEADSNIISFNVNECEFFI